MALDKVLKIYDENGNQVDYDILASDVKFLLDGKDLPTKLTEMEDAIEDAAESGGYTPPQGGIPKTDLAPSVQTSLGLADTALQEADKIQLQVAINAVQTALNNLMNGQSVTDAIDTFNEIVDFLNGIDTDDPTLANQLLALNNAISAVQTSLAAKANSADVYTKTEVDTKVAEAGSGAVSVTTNQDGTFVIHVGSTDYTINLNHTHEGMAKLEKVTEATLPQTLANDTIYVQVDNMTDPQTIEALHIFGLEFTGGGLPAGTPAITKPSGTTLNLGNNEGNGVSKTIEIKANSYITGDLTVALAANTDLSFDTTNLPSGVTYNSGAGTLTIAQATAIQGVNITVVYSGSGAAEIDGGLIITGGGATTKSVVVVVVVPQPIGVKLTGTQWLQTDYYPNANTEFELVCKFTDKGNTPSNTNGYFLTCANNSDATEKFQIVFSNWVLWYTAKNNPNAGLNFSSSAGKASLFLDNSVLSFVKGASNGTFKFVPGGDESKAKSVQTTFMNYTMQNPLRIGRGNTYYFELFELTIYELTITENGTAVRHYVPKIVNGVVGLYDTENNSFISSETAKTSGLATDELEAVYAQNNN